MNLDVAILLAMLLFFVGNLVQGFTGFGVGILPMTGLSLYGEIVEATILVNLGAIITVCSICGRLHRHVSWRHIWPLILGIAIGNPIGLALLKTFGPTHPVIVRRVLGLVIIGFAAWSLSGRHLRAEAATPRVGLAVGLLGGVLGGAFTMAGPPLVAYLYSLPLSRDGMKASLNACFLFNTMYRLGQLLVGGDITAPTLIRFAWCVPAIVAGVVLGLILSRGVGTGRFRRIAWVAFGLMGVLLVAA